LNLFLFFKETKFEWKNDVIKRLQRGSANVDFLLLSKGDLLNVADFDRNIDVILKENESIWKTSKKGKLVSGIQFSCQTYVCNVAKEHNPARSEVVR
jgi:hypothetical protein